MSYLSFKMCWGCRSKEAIIILPYFFKNEKRLNNANGNIIFKAVVNGNAYANTLQTKPPLTHCIANRVPPDHQPGHCNKLNSFNLSTTCHLNCSGRAGQEGGAIFLSLIFENRK